MILQVKSQNVSMHTRVCACVRQGEGAGGEAWGILYARQKNNMRSRLSCRIPRTLGVTRTYE